MASIVLSYVGTVFYHIAIYSVACIAGDSPTGLCEVSLWIHFSAMQEYTHFDQSTTTAKGGGLNGGL